MVAPLSSALKCIAVNISPRVYLNVAGGLISGHSVNNIWSHNLSPRKYDFTLLDMMALNETYTENKLAGLIITFNMQER